MREEQLDVAIVGAGATGVELAAELHNTLRQRPTASTASTPSRTYGDPSRPPRILPGLPERSSRRRRSPSRSSGWRADCRRVAEVLPEGVKLLRRVIAAEITVWAAGMKAQRVLKDLGGIATNRINQIVVLPTLQATRDADIFALGDCAACPWLGKEEVRAAARAVGPPAGDPQGKPAPSAASLLAIPYQEFGSLVSLGEYATVGNLMGRHLAEPPVEGLLARLFYLSLYRLHTGAARLLAGGLDTAPCLISRRTETPVNLYTSRCTVSMSTPSDHDPAQFSSRTSCRAARTRCRK